MQFRFNIKSLAFFLFCASLVIGWYADRSRLANELRKLKFQNHIESLHYELAELEPRERQEMRRKVAARIQMLTAADHSQFAQADAITQYIPMLISLLDERDLRISLAARKSLETIGKRLNSPIEIETNTCGGVADETIESCWRWYDELVGIESY